MSGAGAAASFRPLCPWPATWLPYVADAAVQQDALNAAAIDHQSIRVNHDCLRGREASRGKLSTSCFHARCWPLSEMSITLMTVRAQMHNSCASEGTKTDARRRPAAWDAPWVIARPSRSSSRALFCCGRQKGEQPTACRNREPARAVGLQGLWSSRDLRAASLAMPLQVAHVIFA